MSRIVFRLRLVFFFLSLCFRSRHTSSCQHNLFCGIFTSTEVDPVFCTFRDVRFKNLRIYDTTVSVVFRINMDGAFVDSIPAACVTTREPVDFSSRFRYDSLSGNPIGIRTENGQLHEWREISFSSTNQLLVARNVFFRYFRFDVVCV